jgi:branched-chain amino acid transport system ATP-binding protein
MLALESVVTTYGAVLALDGVSLTVEAGTITAILGANGAGKTTLLRTINGLIRPKTGRITFDGNDLTKTKVEDVVALGIAHGALWRGNAKEAAASMGEVFAMFPPLAERRTRSADTLSGGERQMLAIGRAHMARPRLLLLDEPSLGLAPRITAQIFGTLRQLRDERGLTVVLVEQNARSALSAADHAIILNLGKVVADAPAAQLAGDEQLRHAYLGF